IESSAAADADPPLSERRLQLEPAAADERKIVTDDADLRLVIDQHTRFVDDAIADAHAAAHDQPLRPLARRRQAARDEQTVDAGAHERAGGWGLEKIGPGARLRLESGHHAAGDLAQRLGALAEASQSGKGVVAQLERSSPRRR